MPAGRSPSDPHRALMRTELSRSRFKNATRYADQAAVEEEAPRARAALDGASQNGRQDLRGHQQSGASCRWSTSNRPCARWWPACCAAPTPSSWSKGLRQHDSYSYSHAINCSALAAAFGRHMGFDEETIFSLAAGGLLMDVGKTRLPEQLSELPGLARRPTRWT